MMVLGGLGSLCASVSPPGTSALREECAGVGWGQRSWPEEPGHKSKVLCEGGVHLAGRKTWTYGRKAVNSMPFPSASPGKSGWVGNTALLS